LQNLIIYKKADHVLYNVSRNKNIVESFKSNKDEYIYIEGYTKVEEYYITTYKSEGLDSASVFINKINQLEEQLGEIIQEAQYQNKFKIIMTEQQKEDHKSCKSCWICKNHFTAK
jgi:hypothetical protein